MPPSEDEKNNINDKRRKPMNAENTIMKSMADMLCQQNLITPDEKSRLILLNKIEILLYMHLKKCLFRPL